MLGSELGDEEESLLSTELGKDDGNEDGTLLGFEHGSLLGSELDLEEGLLLGLEFVSPLLVRKTELCLVLHLAHYFEKKKG